jgi:hypothetical protein
VTDIPRVDAAGARRAAAAILHEDRFHGASVPRPLHSLLHDIGTVLDAPARLLSRLAADIGTVLPGGQATGWVVLAALIALVAGLGARRYSRSALAGEEASTATTRDEVTAAGLERAAVRAEADGRYDDAVRLRFRAGLRRLAHVGVVGADQFTPTREIARAVDSAAFDDLAQQFDAIAYGSAAARAADAQTARAGWRTVLRRGGAR